MFDFHKSGHKYFCTMHLPSPFVLLFRVDYNNMMIWIYTKSVVRIIYPALNAKLFRQLGPINNAWPSNKYLLIVNEHSSKPSIPDCN